MFAQIFKKGSKSEPGNYPPVSLTSVVFKTLESLVKDEIVKHLNGNMLLKDSQHGFLSGRSCLTNLLEFFEEVTDCLDKGDKMDIIYLDFSKAFDKVPHKKLLDKTASLGIGGQVISWLDNYLKERK